MEGFRDQPTSAGDVYLSTPPDALQRITESVRAAGYQDEQTDSIRRHNDTPSTSAGLERDTQQPRPRDTLSTARNSTASHQEIRPGLVRGYVGKLRTLTKLGRGPQPRSTERDSATSHQEIQTDPTKGYIDESKTPTKLGREPQFSSTARESAVSHQETQVVPISSVNERLRTPTKLGRKPQYRPPRRPEDTPSTATGAAASDSIQLTPVQSKSLSAELEESNIDEEKDIAIERIPTPSIPSSSNQNDDQPNSCVPALIVAPIDEGEKGEIVSCASSRYTPTDYAYWSEKVAVHHSASLYEEAWGRETQPEIFGWTEGHFVLGPADKDVCISTNPLGHGSLGVVEEVRRIDGQFPTLVRKRISMPVQKSKAAAYLKIVQEEARILRSLVHPHIVTLIGSYEDMKQSKRSSYCLLMSPVGDGDLEAFLNDVGEYDVASDSSIRSRNCISNWMGCLASALEYMHASGIRHQDIKPSNIIHKGDHILFTDFSSSSSFKVGHTTSTENPARSTPMYGAPEVTFDRGRHGCATDIFSLGCVFSDMLSVVEGRTVSDLQDYLRNDGNAAATDTRPFPRGLSYSEKVPAIKNWFAESHVFNAHVAQMLHPDRKMRPTAGKVLEALLLNMRCDLSCVCLRIRVPQGKLEALSVTQAFVKS